MIDVGKEMAQARMMKQAKSVRDDILMAAGKVFNVNEHTVIIEAEYDVKTYELQCIGFSQIIELDAIAPINNLGNRILWCFSTLYFLLALV